MLQTGTLSPQQMQATAAGGQKYNIYLLNLNITFLIKQLQNILTMVPKDRYTVKQDKSFCLNAANCYN